MFQRPTVFVIGAGCSAEFGLPLGDGLRDMIGQRLPSRTDWEETEAKWTISTALQTVAGSSWRPYLDACDRIKRGLRHASSIDRFLDFHQEDEQLVVAGKIGIAEAILAAEAQCSALRVRAGHLDPNQLGHNWLSNLFVFMQEGARKSRLEEIFRNTTFVCFNYDRCIEHYFYYAIKAFASASNEEAAAAVKHLKVYHPYGRVGGLEWDGRPGEPVIAFGQEGMGGPTISRVAQGIRTFAERVEEGDELDQMRRAVQSAKQIVFLGFSFLDQNMDLLRPEAACSASRIYGTVFGESEPNVYLAGKSIKKMLKGSSPGPKGFPIDDLVPTPTLVGSKALDFVRAHGNQLRR